MSPLRLRAEGWAKGMRGVPFAHSEWMLKGIEVYAETSK